jgi:group II intron reverse transcriptase/maturase
VAQILTAIYEMDFLPCSYGYRPGLGPHNAVRALTDELHWGNHNFLVEADIRGFFDNIGQEWILKMLGERINDGAILGLIRKWLRAGILEEDGKVIHPQTGTPQGGVVSPILANVYLHYVLDLWFEHRVRKENQGCSRLFRFADDFVACFEYRHEAEAFEKALRSRLAKFGLQVAEEKTKTLRFGRNGGPHNGRFDFLGFEFYWEEDRKGRPTVKKRTARKKWRAAVNRMTEWIKTSRHKPVRELMKTLAAKLRGTWRYYGVIGNSQSLGQYYYATRRTVFRWLNRRSQRRSYTWKQFDRMTKRFGIPPPRIVEKLDQGMPYQLELNLHQRLARFLKRVWRKVEYARAS